jgi:cytochrome c-type biogenesis protein
VMFILLGASVAFLGLLLNRAIVWMQRVGGVVIIVLGLSTLGLLKLPFLYTDRRIHVGAKPRLGYLSSLLMGVFFSAGWIPCVGPVLAAIYLLAGSTQTVGQGALLLATYSLGLGLPFMITGAALSTIGGWLQRVNRHLRVVSIVTGLLLLAIGILLLFDQFQLLSILLAERLGGGLGIAEVSIGESGAITLPLAFLAGLLSFFSPCVVPLIPGYLGYLSGTVLLANEPTPTSG